MKTIETANALSIEERAREYATSDEYPNSVWLKQGYTAGATEQKAIMLKEASKGFEEWYVISSDIPVQKNQVGLRTFHLDSLEKTWQAATLSAEKIKQKEIEELKKNVRGAIKYMEAHDYQQYDPCEPEYQMYASLKNALSTVESR